MEAGAERHAVSQSEIERYHGAQTAVKTRHPHGDGYGEPRVRRRLGAQRMVMLQGNRASIRPAGNDEATSQARIMGVRLRVITSSSEFSSVSQASNIRSKNVRLGRGYSSTSSRWSAGRPALRSANRHAV